MITIVDYDCGNVNAIINAFKELGINAKVSKSINDIDNASKLILPGVGSYDYAMKRLFKSGLIDSLNNSVLKKKIPILGICVGMQILGNKSDEGKLPGLGWVDAEVSSFKDTNSIDILPHMGWNNIKIIKDNLLLSSIDENSIFYFLHSYYFKSYNKENIIAKCKYGLDFTCAINSDNIYGVQFHPEKSHSFGLKILQNFSKI